MSISVDPLSEHSDSIVFLSIRQDGDREKLFCSSDDLSDGVRGDRKGMRRLSKVLKRLVVSYTMRFSQRVLGVPNRVTLDVNIDGG